MDIEDLMRVLCEGCKYRPSECDQECERQELANIWANMEQRIEYLEAENACLRVRLWRTEMTKTGRQTNADYIRSLSNKDLAEYLSQTFCHGYAAPYLLDWLNDRREDER